MSQSRNLTPPFCPACEQVYGHRAARNRMVGPEVGSWSGLLLWRCPNREHHPTVYEDER